MLRRTLLTAASTTLAGCGLTPAPPSAESYPESPPNAFFSYRWLPDRTACAVRFDRGNRLTPANTAALRIRSDDGDGETVWVSRDADAEASYPLEPGAVLRHPVGDATGLRVIWTGPDGDRSVVFGRAVRPTPAAEDGG
ncbi:hypothetical protein [Haloarcula amylovorans]|uniref:hypothetical protein n=1 Tax=Haloarcula amylovorans TaxID=2562280 RepID=UPI001075E365|nr:hypothetical protein [Halomicroarcula amylolytica]